MPSATWSSAKAKVQLRLSVQRLRTIQQKREAQAKSSRRDIALLLEKGKLESARIKVEASGSSHPQSELYLFTQEHSLATSGNMILINDDVNLELLELLELYCELLISRFGLLDQNTREPDPGINEGVCAIIHAAQRAEVKELQILRELLMHKYGREFSAAVMENRGGCVSDRVVKKLVVETPSPQLVDGYLTEIAKAYGVKWTSPTALTVGRDEGSKVGGQPLAAEEPSEALPVYSEDGLSGHTPKLPDLPPTEDEDEKSNRQPDQAGPPESPADDFESLARRFQALKKR
ncbi:DUF292-domain-containing protein [Melanogaster broomeanus]|nr:DUF292-domain-containing protein [Melanogaster broomeanus]